jgi:hypothetical protein
VAVNRQATLRLAAIGPAIGVVVVEVIRGTAVVNIHGSAWKSACAVFK